MDITFTNVLEGARQYFQGLPSPASSSSSQTPQGGSGVNEPATSNSPRYSNPDSGAIGSTPPRYDNVSHRSSIVNAASQQPAATSTLPPQPQQHLQHSQQQNVAAVPSSSSSSVLSYWPPAASANSVYQRTKDSTSHPGPPQSQHLYASSKMSAVSSASQVVAHTVYNGSRLTVQESRTINYQHQNHLQQQQQQQQQQQRQQQQQQQQPRPQGHNLPPIAALPNYHSNRNVRDTAHRLSQHHSQAQQHISSLAVPTQQVPSKMVVANSTSVLRTQSEYTSPSQQNHTPQYAGANSNTTVGSSNAGTLQYGLHRGPKYSQQQQQQLGTTTPTSVSYSNYTSQQMPQQQAASTSISSSSSTSSTSVYQSSLHHSQQQQPQQQYAYHPPHHSQGTSSHSTQPELLMKPDHQQPHPTKRQHSTHQAYYNPSAPGRPQPAVPSAPTSNVLANGHQRTLPPSPSTASAMRTGRSKRESPLDLSVKTVRQSADSTAKDDMESNYTVASYSPAAVDHQSRVKSGAASIQNRTHQSGAVLPPLQLPSSVAYPTFDSRGSRAPVTPATAVGGSVTPNAGAPKVDFLPNFGVSQQNSTASGNCVSESHQRPSGRTNPVHHQLYSQASSVTQLPHVGSFKKNSTTVNLLQGSYDQKQSQYYASAISQSQQRHSNTNSSSSSAMLPPYSASSNHYPTSGYESVKRITDPVQNYMNSRLIEFQTQGTNQNSTTYKNNSVSVGHKRGSDVRHISTAKVPRLDLWKQTIDQQIEQRFSSYTLQQQQQQQQQQQPNQQQQVNGNLDTVRHDTQYTTHHPHHRQTILHHQSQQPNHHHPTGHSRTAVPSIATTVNQSQHGYHSTPQASPYVPSHNNQQYPTSHVGSQPMAQQPSATPRSHNLPRLLTSSGLSPQLQAGRNNTTPNSGGMADKRVISILRNSLEIKEARMTELQHQLQQNQLQQQQNVQQQLQQQKKQQVIQTHQQNRQASNQYQQLGQQQNHQLPPLAESPVQIMAHQKLPPATALTGRHNLPPFGVTSDTNNAQQAIQVQAHKIHVPKAVDSVPYDAGTESLASRLSNNNVQGVIVPETTQASVPPNSSSSADLDGFAALIAARIRTKAELKQVGPSLEQMNNSQQQQFRCPTPASSVVSASNSSVHSPRTTPGTPIVFSPPPQTVQAAADTGSDNILSPVQENIVSERTPPPNSQMQQNQSAQSGSGASSSGGSPPKLTRERVVIPPRRKLFSRPDEEPGGCVGVSNGGTSNGSSSLVPPRDSSGLRSSSETSVFDFPDSDSEGEMPVLEIQTLDDMRKKKSHTKQQIQTPSAIVPEAIELSEEAAVDTTTVPEMQKEVESRPSSPFDPFWSASCDKFLEQLQTGITKGKHRRKKTVAELKAIPDKVEARSDTKEIKVEDEPEERVKPEEKVKPEVRVKLEENVKPEEKVKSEGKEKPEEKVEIKSEDKIKSEKKKNEKFVNKENKRKDDSDEDVPLIRRRGRPRKKKDIDADVEDEISLAEIKARLGRAEKSITSETPKRVRSRSRSSSSVNSSTVASSEDEKEADESDSHEETVAERLRRRKRQDKEGHEEEGGDSIGMRLRSKAPTTPHKTATNEKEKVSEISGKSVSKKKKPQFGDGSDFRPGWEEEVYRFKRSLRMPAQLINISRPPNTHRISASLPDLDPYPNSPAASTADSTDFISHHRIVPRAGGSLDRRHGTWSSIRSDFNDSDLDSNSNLSATWHQGRRTEDLGVDSEEATSSTTVSSKLKNNVNNDNNNSILNHLVNKYGRSPRKKSKEKNLLSERSGPRIIPRSSSGPELLPTPSLGIGLTKVSPSKNDDKKGRLHSKKHKSKKNTHDAKGEKESVCDIKDSVYLGYFRKKTVTNFRDAFRQNGGILAEKFAPIVYKSRTRTQTRVLQQRATIREVFGDDRPASAPPTCHEDRVDISQSEIKEKKQKFLKGDKTSTAKNWSCAINIGRPGLRSAGLRRSNKAVLNSKRRLLRRDHGLLHTFTSQKLPPKDASCDSREPAMLLPQQESRESSVTKASTTASSPPSSTSQQMVDAMVPPNGKRIKLRSVRRKFRSGFDYIRKKKKQQKREGEAEGIKEKKKSSFPRPSSESVQDIQTEIRGWVINKGLGETLLHRAARLGYTDVAAYCLEKLDNPPSPRDNAGYTPLHEACSRGHLEIARLLLMYGANVSDSALGGIRPLHEAAENGFTELIRLLLSYGADPLLATYSGYTPLSLALDDEARRLLQQHLADVQGLPAPPWTFQGPASCFDPLDSGYDPLSDPPCSSPEPPDDNDIEMETSEMSLPVLYRLRCEPPAERWVLLQELTQLLRIKSRDALLKQLCAEAKSVLREFKMADFLEQARCCHLACGSERINIRASKVALVKYNDRVRQLLGVEKVTISLR